MPKDGTSTSGATGTNTQQQLVPHSGHRSGLKFVQLYTSKSYENRRNELINPPENENDVEDSLRPDNYESDDSSVEKHVLSPRLVNSIYESAQVVWASSHSPGGLIGRSDIQLQTAVGLPVAVDSSGNMCVVVMFSPNIIPSTDDAMEYLHSISLSATSRSIPCLMPVFNENSTRGRQIFALPSSQSHAHHSGSELGEGVTARFVSLDEGHGQDNDASDNTRHDLMAAPKDTFGIPMLPCFAELNNVAPVTPEENLDIFDEASYGIWNTIMDPEQVFRDEMIVGEMNGSIDSNFDLHRDLQSGNECTLVEGTSLSNDMISTGGIMSSSQASANLLENYSSRKTSLSEGRKLRLEEFCEAFLGMSVFDAADVWVAADDYPDCIQNVMSILAPNDRNESLREFNNRSSDVLIKFWTGAVGRAYSSGNPVWSANHSVFVDPGRALAFARAKIQTVLAVPVFTGKEIMPTCVVSFYSLVKSGSVPFVLKFVQQALRLLWDGLDKIKPHKNVENVWQEVHPADLGEMAADLEMQHSFLSKKRRHEFGDYASQNNTSSYAAPVAENSSDDSQTERLASSLQEINLPSGETITVPLQLYDYNLPMQEQMKGEIRQGTKPYPHQQTTIVPLVHLATVTNVEGTKRAHVMVGQPLSSSSSLSNGLRMPSPLQMPSPLRMPNALRMPSPLPLPGALPKHVISRNSPSSSPSASRTQFQTHYTGSLPSPPSPVFAQQNSPASSASPTLPKFLNNVPTTFSYMQPLNTVGTEQVGRNHFEQQQHSDQLRQRHEPSFPSPHQQNVYTQQDNQNQFFNHQTMLNSETNVNRIPQNQSMQPFQGQPQSEYIFQQTAQQHRQSPYQNHLFEQAEQLLIKSQTPSEVSGGNLQHQSPVFHASENETSEFEPNMHVQNDGWNNYFVPVGVEAESSMLVQENASLDFVDHNSIYCMTAKDESSDDSSPSEPKVCRIQECTETAVSRRPYCVKHSGNRLCEHPGCPKCAQGSTRYCIAHGGGRRCTFPGCDKGARDKFYCAAHGGGKRCAAGDCSKSAVGGSTFCTAHGGGRRCSVEGCDKSAQSSTSFCVKHGGGKKCAQSGCEKVARGRTNYCAAHGGGVRCKLEGCNRVAIGKMQLCRTHGGGSRQNRKLNSKTSMSEESEYSSGSGFDTGLRNGFDVVFAVGNARESDFAV